MKLFFDKKKRWTKSNIASGDGYFVRYNYARKTRCLKHYGGEKPSCKCCGVSLIQFLVLDHIQGGGTKHRDFHKNNIWGWIERNDYPDGFQVLCTICNASKRNSNECVYHKYIPK